MKLDSALWETALDLHERRQRADRPFISRPVKRAPTLICSVALALTAATGCSVGPKMFLSPAPPKNPGGLTWWLVGEDGPPHRAIVGIERRAAPDTLDQFIFCKRGVRLFRYEGNRIVRVGPPVPPAGGVPDWPISRWVLRRLTAETGEVPPLPTDAVNRTNSMRALIDLLESNWSGVRVHAPLRLTRAEVESAVEDFPHGLTELMAASDAF